jgi:hypothetical protein
MKAKVNLNVHGGAHALRPNHTVRQHDTLMKHTTVILALSLLLTACSRHDAEFTKQIPGTWKQELRSYTNTLTIVSDGSFAFSRFTTNADTTFTNTGTWLIRDGGIVHRADWCTSVAAWRFFQSRDCSFG